MSAREEARRAMSKANPRRPWEDEPEPKPRKPLKRTDPTPRRMNNPKRSTGLRPTRRGGRPGGQQAGLWWREACLERNVERFGAPTCEATLRPLEADWSCHHVLDVASLNAMGFGDSEFLIWNPWNGMCVNRKPHLDHHNWSPRITADKLQDHHWEFAVLLDNTHGTEWATEKLRRDYPEEAPS